ncbi:hypothetical protein ACHAXA_004699 [Cyclostephanos tholiformis]|uniref:Uncharacterized protein n=1 Tax=Cyclostephanos tholiformis TaxID=382380 RepID=A0ABD3SRI5_9STRA
MFSTRPRIGQNRRGLLLVGHHASARSRFVQAVIREMEATVQFKKYRAMRRRYGEGSDVSGEAHRIGEYVRGDILKRR